MIENVSKLGTLKPLHQIFGLRFRIPFNQSEQDLLCISHIISSIDLAVMYFWKSAADYLLLVYRFHVVLAVHFFTQQVSICSCTTSSSPVLQAVTVYMFKMKMISTKSSYKMLEQGRSCFIPTDSTVPGIKKWYWYYPKPQIFWWVMVHHRTREKTKASRGDFSD